MYQSVEFRAQTSGDGLLLRAFGAQRSGYTPVLVDISLYRLSFRRPEKDESFPVGPPCRARLDLVVHNSNLSLQRAGPSDSDKLIE